MPPLRHFDERFEREQGCTEAEWLGWLPGAVREHTFELPSPGRAVVHIGAGSLAIDWTPMPPRRIALISMPRMAIRYAFSGLDAGERSRFMQYFDLYMQRGGG